RMEQVTRACPVESVQRRRVQPSRERPCASFGVSFGVSFGESSVWMSLMALFKLKAFSRVLAQNGAPIDRRRLEKPNPASQPPMLTTQPKHDGGTTPATGGHFRAATHIASAIQLCCQPSP